MVSPALLTLLTFLAGVTVILGIYSVLTDLFLRDRSRVRDRLDTEFRQDQRERVKKSSLFKHLDKRGAQAAEVDDAGPGLVQRLDSVVEQSGLDLTLRRLFGIMGISALVLAGLSFLVLRHPFAALAGVVGAAVPLVYVYRKRKIRLEKLLEQLPDAFDLMARVIRAGQTVSQAMLAVADEFDAPISTEFAYCYEQQNMGLSPEVTLRDLVRRTGLLEIKIFVLAMVVQQQTGGNLADLLDKLAGVVRERFRIGGKIKTLTAEGRFQAVVLLVLPIAVYLIISFINPRYARVLFDHPNLVVGMIVMESIGALWIRKIVNFDF
jgi:tight adherence protein B